MPEQNILPLPHSPARDARADTIVHSVKDLQRRGSQATESAREGGAGGGPVSQRAAHHTHHHMSNNEIDLEAMEFLMRAEFRGQGKKGLHRHDAHNNGEGEKRVRGRSR